MPGSPGLTSLRRALALALGGVALLAPTTAAAGTGTSSGPLASPRAAGHALSREPAATIAALDGRSGCTSPVTAVTAVSAGATREVADRARRFHVTNPFGSHLFGVDGGGAIQNETPAQMREDVADDARAGAHWLRMDVNWAQIQEAGPHHYYWRAIDRVVARARRCGMKVLGTVVFSPGWARPPGTSGTDAPNPREYARFAAAAARHLGHRGVDALEIWNEPNVNGFWGPHPNARAYTRLLRDADRAIHRVDPRMLVVTGGLAPAANTRRTIAPVTFLRRMYRDGAKGSFDAVGQHPYCWPAYPGARLWWSAWYQMYGGRNSLRAVMRAHGDGAKRIWATEFGAPTYGPKGSSFVSLDTQAVMVARAYRLWAHYRWAGPLFIYQGRDLGWQGTTIQNFFGLFKYDFAPKPSFDSYRRDALLVADALARRDRHPRARRR